MVDEYLKLYFKIMGCELNKIFYMKEMLSSYYTHKNFSREKGDNEYNFELKKLDFVNDSLPEIDNNEILPLDRIDYIEEKIISFFDDFEHKLDLNRDSLPRVFLSKFNDLGICRLF